jgi:hypothetical protein
VLKQIGFRDAWSDPNVKAALKTRRAADIYLMCCSQCGNYSYYNEGSHFTCSWCEHYVRGEELDRLIDNGEAITLDDYTEMQVEEPDVP